MGKYEVIVFYLNHHGFERAETTFYVQFIAWCGIQAEVSRTVSTGHAQHNVKCKELQFQTGKFMAQMQHWFRELGTPSAIGCGKEARATSKLPCPGALVTDNQARALCQGLSEHRGSGARPLKCHFQSFLSEYRIEVLSVISSFTKQNRALLFHGAVGKTR